MKKDPFKISPTLALPEKFVTWTQAILGKKRGGKSYKASVQAEELLEAGHQIIVLDPTSAWWGLRSSADGRSVGYPITIFGGDHGDLPLDPATGAAIAEALVSDRFSCVIDTSHLDEDKELQFAIEFLRTLYRNVKSTAMHLFIDEADLFAPELPPDKDAARCRRVCRTLIRRGGIKGIGCTLITQRPADLDKSVLSQVDMVTLLRMSHPTDLDPVEKWTKKHDIKGVAKTMLDSLPALAKGDAWVWCPDVEIFSRITFRDRRTFDSGRTPDPGERSRAPKVLARVDLERLGAAIQSTIANVRANDPKALRTRVAELERHLRDAAATNDGLGTAAMRAESAERAVAQLRARVTELEQALRAAGAKLDEAGRLVSDRLTAAPAMPEPAPAAARWQPPRGVPTAPRPTAPPARPSTAVRQKVPRTAETRTLSVGEIAILSALIQYPAGLSPEQLTVMCGYKKSSRNTYLQRLKSDHMVVHNGRFLVATPAGIEAVPNAAPLPVGQALLSHWRGKLPEGERKLFDVLVAAYPNAVDRETLCESTGYKKSSTNTYLLRLRAREVITSGRDGVRASEALFTR